MKVKVEMGERKRGSKGEVFGVEEARRAQAWCTEGTHGRRDGRKGAAERQHEKSVPEVASRRRWEIDRMRWGRAQERRRIRTKDDRNNQT